MEMKTKNMIEDSGSLQAGNGGGGVQCQQQKELPPQSGGGGPAPQPGSHDYAPLPPQQQTLKDNSTTVGASDDYTSQPFQHLVANPTADGRLVFFKRCVAYVVRIINTAMSTVFNYSVQTY